MKMDTWFKLIQAICSIALAAITLTIGWYAYKQWQSLNETLEQTRKMVVAAQDQAKIARNESLKGSRAWVGVSNIMLKKDLHEEEPVVVQIIFINSGKTPAVETETKAWINLYLPKKEGEYNFSKKKSAQQIKPVSTHARAIFTYAIRNT